MTKCFLGKGRYESKIITLSAARNIYMLYQVLKKDDFETDVVEVLRDTVELAKDVLAGISRQDIDEIYMFFDYDIQQNNIRHGEKTVTADSALREMLSVFNNETEHGKLYVNYPMVEALYDYKRSSCEAFYSCYVPIDRIKEYKTSSGENNPNASKHMQIEDWKDILNAFYLRIKCLFEFDELSFDEYQNKVTPYEIYLKETILIVEKKKVFVLSAFPEFLFDYFRLDFWKTMTPIKKYKFEKCERMGNRA